MRYIIKKLLRESLLDEEKFYGKNQIQQLANKFGTDPNNEEFKNMVALAAIYRRQFGDINQFQIYDDLVDKASKWKENILGILNQVPEFTGDKQKYLDAYINNLKTLNGNVEPVTSVKNVEKNFFDIINNNQWVKSSEIAQKHSLENPKSEDIAYEDDNVMVIDSDNRDKCVIYGQGESWCIGKRDQNYYNTYRIKYKATPYHTLLKKRKETDTENYKIVMMVYPNDRYAIADRGNSHYHGGPDQAASYEETVARFPELKHLQKVFKYREVTAEEEEYDDLINNQYNYDDLMGYILDVTNDLPNITPEDFIRDYAVSNQIKDSQINSLTPSMVDSLIESGFFIMNMMSNDIFDKKLTEPQKRRVVKLISENEGVYNSSMLKYLPEQELVDYIYSMTDNDFNEMVHKTNNIDELVGYFNKYARPIPKLTHSTLVYLIRDNNQPLHVLNKLGVSPDSYSDEPDCYYMSETIRNVKNISDYVKIYGPAVKDCLSELDNYVMSSLLSTINDENKAALINLLGLDSKAISEFSETGLQNVLAFSQHPINVLKMFGNIGEKALENFNGYHIKYLIEYGRNKDEIRKILQHPSVDILSNLEDVDKYNLIGGADNQMDMLKYIKSIDSKLITNASGWVKKEILNLFSPDEQNEVRQELQIKEELVHENQSLRKIIRVKFRSLIK